MELEIIAIYCWVELILNQLNIKDDCRTEMSHAEVLTTAIVAVRFFSGNFQNACNFLSEHGYVLKMLSKSRFKRRLHKLGPELIGDIQKIIGEIFKSLNTAQEYAVDSFPVPFCENVRIFHSKIYTEEKYRGHQASTAHYPQIGHSLAAEHHQPRFAPHPWLWPRIRRKPRLLTPLAQRMSYLWVMGRPNLSLRQTGTFKRSAIFG